MKVVSVLLILLGLAAMGMGLAGAPSNAPNAPPLPKVAMREVGKVPTGSVAPEKSAPAPKAEAPVANTGGKALEKALEKTQEKPNDDLEAPERPAAKAPPAEKAPPPAEKAPPPEKAAPEKAATGERPAPPPAPAKAATAAKAPAEKPAAAENAPAEAPAAVMGMLNLRASDTADVYVDGKKVGGSPLLGLKVKPGKHKVRFDCYLPSGETKAGPTQSYDVAADAEREVEYECPQD